MGANTFFEVSNMGARTFLEVEKVGARTFMSFEIGGGLVVSWTVKFPKTRSGYQVNV